MGGVFIAPNIKRESVRIDPQGNIINAKTREIIKPVEPEYIPPAIPPVIPVEENVLAKLPQEPVKTSKIDEMISKKIEEIINKKIEEALNKL